MLIMDEMYIKEDLVYNKQSGEVVGFANLIDTNMHLLEFEKTLKGRRENLTSSKDNVCLDSKRPLHSLEYPYAQFPCSVLSGDLLYDLVWEAVFRLERVGLKVLTITADGASTNRLFFWLHNPKSGQDEIIYKVSNPYCHDGRSLYFFSDSPHLIKLVRNSLEKY